MDVKKGFLWGVCLFMGSMVHAGVQIESSSFNGEDYVSTSQAISIQLNHLPKPSDGDLSVWVGETDVTPLFSMGSSGELIYNANLLSLPSGEATVTVFLVKGENDWAEVGSLPINVRSRLGADQAEVDVSINLEVASQWDEGHSIDALAPDDSAFHDFTGQSALNTRQLRGSWEVQSNFNFIGVDDRSRALRFNEEGGSAPRIDLSDYQVDINRSNEKFNSNLKIGHINYGQNRLLINGMSTRGAAVTQRLGDRVDVSAVMMNGTEVVGSDNIFGLNDRGHRVTASSVGIDILGRRPGNLRAEVTYMDAQIKSQFNFNAGEVPDAEVSNGVGVILSGSTPSGRLSSEFGFARSSYHNPSDPFLEQGDILAAVEESKDDAKYLDLSYQLVQGYELLGRYAVNLTASANAERVDPLYKSLGAFVSADQSSKSFSLGGQVGALNISTNLSISEDNIDNISSVLKTKTRSTGIQINVPLRTLFDDLGKASHVVPDVIYANNNVHQYGVNTPVSFDPDSHVPDQYTKQHEVGLTWQGNRWGLSYNAAFSDQDNRQVGRAKADFLDFNQSLLLDLDLTDNLSLSAGVGRSRAADRENILVQNSRDVSAGYNWAINQSWSLSGNYSASQQDDTQGLTESNGHTAQNQLAWQFNLPGYSGRTLPGQLFVSHALQSNESIDNEFGFSSLARTWAFTSGISLSLN